LADAIVDIVETGETLRENGLIVFEDICDISARLIANKAALKMKKDEMFAVIDRLEEALAKQKGAEV
jgi:ATP phosphoribosyltransferase